MKALVKKLWHANSSIVAIAQTVLANIAIQGANIACGVISARTLGPSGRGELAAVIMWPQLLAYTLTLGTPVSYVYFIKKRPDLARGLSGASIVLSLGSGLVGSLIGCIIIPLSLHTYPVSVIRFAQTMVFLAPVGLCAITLTVQVMSSGSFTKYNIFRFISPLSILVIIIVLKLSGSLSAHNAALAYLLAGMPALFWLAYLVWKNQNPRFTNLKSPITLLLGYGVRAWGADLLGTVASQVDRVLIVGMLEPALMGLYVVAQSAAGVLAVIPTAVNSVILPRTAGHSNQDIRVIVGRAVRMTLFIMLLASLPLFLCGNFLLHLVYGNKFSGAALILPFLVVEAILDGLTSVLSQAFLASGHPGIVTLLQGCGVVSAIPLIYLMIPIWGVRGAACALMIATAARFTFIVSCFPFRLKMRPPNIFISIRELKDIVRTKQLIPVSTDTKS